MRHNISEKLFSKQHKTKMETIRSECRVCSEAGHYDLSEMKFRCNDNDVLLIEAFNAFSAINNVSEPAT